jgi:XisI protein
MDKLENYRSIITSILEKYEKIMPFNLTEVENELIMDTVRDSYQLVRVGFENRSRIHYCVFHFDIRNDKIWVQHDITDIPVAQLLLDAGVPKEDLVLGFHAPYMREISGFAVA